MPSTRTQRSGVNLSGSIQIDGIPRRSRTGIVVTTSRSPQGPGAVSDSIALLEVKIHLSELIYRYGFTREGVEAVEYDPEFQLIRPLNLYCTAKRRTQWPSKSVPS
ncbi:hypothetical protein GE09DRAFT_9250 [Coniochaeta sp. 2T2.1]|nr:hypothetical protein GE09DRAFT_9250 [Coniochaeta sp. 2T2.1]